MLCPFLKKASSKGRSKMTKMTEEWALLWMQCLFQNMDYQKYCIHSDADDEEEEKAELAQKFPLIADLYEDFGYERSWPKLGLDDTKWRDWFEPRRHLFMADIKELKAGEEAEHKNGFITLHLPLQKRLSETVADVEAFLSPLYATKAFESQPEPKYRLNLKRDGRVAIGYEEVRQAVITSTDEELFDAYITGKRLTVKQAQIGFLRRKINDLGWSLTVFEKRKLIDAGYLDEDIYESMKTRINRSRKLFGLLSANAIYASFPNNKVIDSESWDYFKNQPINPVKF
jgi:hypothetical protein